MTYEILANLTVITHFLFILFVVFGGILIFFNEKWAWLHCPAIIWGIFIECSGGICPLTPLENFLRTKGTAPGYENSFIGHYLLPVIYPEGLTHNIQIILGFLLLALNLFIYSAVFIRHRKKDIEN